MIYDSRFMESDTERIRIKICIIFLVLYLIPPLMTSAESLCTPLWRVLKSRELCDGTEIKVMGRVVTIMDYALLQGTEYQYGFFLKDENRNMVRVLVTDPIVLVEGKELEVSGVFRKSVEFPEIVYEDVLETNGSSVLMLFTANELYQDILADYGRRINLLKRYENWSLIAAGVVPLSLVGVFFFGYWFYQRRRVKGRTFEGYIESLFPKQEWAILESQAYRKLGRWVSSYSNPDFLFLHRRTKKKVAVECKFKLVLGSDQNRIIWADEEQIEKYYQFSEQKKVPVFVVIGVGGNPKKPRRMFLLPLRKIRYPDVAVEYLAKFERNPSPTFSIEELQKVYAED